jgi:hypothetical protein
MEGFILFYFYIACSQIWQNHLMDDCQFSYNTKLEKRQKKNTINKKIFFSIKSAHFVNTHQLGMNRGLGLKVQPPKFTQG